MTEGAAREKASTIPAALAGAGAASLALYATLVACGNLLERVPAYLAIHAALFGLMLVGWRAASRSGGRALKLVLAAGLLFRLVLAIAPPSLSDDVYRYVWDGKVQAQGHHPYKYAPDDPMREEFRDADYAKINHPEIPTVYPPLAEMLFALLATAHLGVAGFKVAFALLDAGVALALVGLLDALELPRDRVVLYAWNPLAIVESAGSGHVEPLGLLLVVLAVAWIARGKGFRAAAALGAAIQAKLLPLILLPGFIRRLRTSALVVGGAVVVVMAAPYAIRGPWIGGGTLAYAERWEHGAVLFAGVRRVYATLDLTPVLKAGIAWAQARWGSGSPAFWDVLYKHVWPDNLARVTVIVVALAWAIAQSFRAAVNAAHEARLAIGAALLLAPTMHPWYILWVLPFAVAEVAGGWLLLGALVPLQYIAGGGEVPWAIRLVIVLPAIAWMTWDSLVRSRR